MSTLDREMNSIVAEHLRISAIVRSPQELNGKQIKKLARQGMLVSQRIEAVRNILDRRSR